MPKSFSDLLAEDRAYISKLDAKTMESDFKQRTAMKAQLESLKKDLAALEAAIHAKYNLCTMCRAAPVPPGRSNCACCIDEARG